MSAMVAAIAGGAAAVAGASALTVAGVAAGAGALSYTSQQKAQSAANRASASQAAAAQGLAASSDYAAELSYDLGQQELEFARQQYEELSPIAKQVAESQIAAQNEQMRQAREYYDYQMGTFRPVEQGLVAQAQRFNTEAYREQLARQAAADAGRAFGVTQAANQRAMASMGVNPASGRFQGIQAASNLGLAAQRAQAMTGTRERAEQLGYARQLDVAGLGRGLPGASTAAYAGATGAGSAGLASAATPGTMYMQGLNQASGTMMQGAGQRIGGYGSLLGSQTSLANAALAEQYGMAGGLMGTVGTLGAAYIGR